MARPGAVAGSRVVARPGAMARCEGRPGVVARCKAGGQARGGWRGCKGAAQVPKVMARVGRGGRGPVARVAAVPECGTAAGTSAQLPSVLVNCPSGRVLCPSPGAAGPYSTGRRRVGARLSCAVRGAVLRTTGHPRGCPWSRGPLCPLYSRTRGTETPGPASLLLGSITGEWDGESGEDRRLASASPGQGCPGGTAATGVPDQPGGDGRRADRSRRHEGGARRH